MGAHENLEHAEHAAHSGAHAGKRLGVTMALLAVLIAFAAAMVGSQRQELMTSLMDQSWAHNSYTAASTKFRLIMLDLERMRDTLQPNASAEGGSPVLKRLLHLYSDYHSERALAQAWDDSCEPLIDAHFDAAEGYEHGQLIAELAVIMASLAILLNSRAAWILSIVVGAVCLGEMAFTYTHTRQVVAENHAKVHEAEHAFEELRAQHLSSKADEETVDALDPDGKIRASFGDSSKKEHGTDKEE